MQQKLDAAAAAVPLVVKASEEAYQLFHRLRSGLSDRALSVNQRKLIAMVLHAEDTSRAVESLRRSNLRLQGLALLRVRYEQTTVCSYLIHQNSEELYRRYFDFGPIAEYQHARAMAAEPALAPQVAGRVDLAALASQAADVERTFNPGFDIDKGKFAPKWTQLDLYSMALKRDERALQTGLSPSIVPLAPLYVSIYKVGSAVVHADASVLAPPFTGDIVTADGQAREAGLFWDMALPAFLAHLDIVQCYEVSRACGATCEQQYLDIIGTLAT